MLVVGTKEENLGRERGVYIFGKRRREAGLLRSCGVSGRMRWTNGEADIGNRGRG